MTDVTTFMGGKKNRYTVQRQEETKPVLGALLVWAAAKPYCDFSIRMISASGPGWPGDMPKKYCTSSNK